MSDYITNLDLIKVRPSKAGIDCNHKPEDKCNCQVGTWKWNSCETGRFTYDKSLLTWSDMGFLSQEEK